MPDASPIRWHLAHTTWFFETFVLAHSTRFREFDESFRFLFNSYYNTVGEQFSRPQRGLLSRPNQQQVEAYRQHVDEAMLELLSNNASDDLKNVIEVGLHHEQQHQELILTDIKHALSCNPLLPVYRDGCIGGKTETVSPGWLPFDEGVRAIGHEGGDFAYDNESPRHRVFLDAFEICDRLVSCGQYIQFIDDGGYQRPELWLSLGWNQRQAGDWTSPLYWTDDDGRWSQFTLAGLQPVGLDQPLTHISYFEADAFARWSGCRLPTEAEWELAANPLAVEGRFADTLLSTDQAIHPTCGAEPGQGPHQMFGDVWEWTASPYSAYPGYQPPAGALGEYNGKFMCNQFVLRGGSCATSQGHIRSTYRNFFPPEARWQFSGLRLARSAGT